MRFRHVLALGAAALGAIVAVPAGAAGDNYSNLQPGVQSAGLSERVPVNVVFVGFSQSQVNRGAVPRRTASALQPDRPLSTLVRNGRGARDRLHVRLRRHLHEPRVGERVLHGARGPGSSGPAHGLPGHLQRAGRHARRRRQPLHRRTDGREVADRPRAVRRQHPPEHDLLRQLVGPVGLHRPRLHEVRRARSRHGLRLRRQPGEPQDHRLGRHDGGRRGDWARLAAASVASGSSTCRPGRRRGAATTTSPSRTSTATTWPTTGSRSRGSTRRTAIGRRAQLTGDLSKVARYAAST